MQFFCCFFNSPWLKRWNKQSVSFMCVFIMLDPTSRLLFPQWLICDVTVDLPLAEHAQWGRYLFLKGLDFAKNTAHLFCDPPVSPQLHCMHIHYLTCREIRLDCWNIFPKKKKKKGAQCSTWEEPVASTSTPLGFLRRSIYSIVDLGVVTSPSCSRQQWKICLGVHIHSRVNFSSRMSEGCRKITRGRQGREILVQTHEQRTYALTYALIRDALLYCQAGVAQADN